MIAVLYMLDSDMVIFILRGLKAPVATVRSPRVSPGARNTMPGSPGEGRHVRLSAVTVSELEFRAYHSGAYETKIVAVRQVLTPFEKYDYDGATSPTHYGRIRHELERSGQTIGAMDLLIAAHALALDATLVTNNLGHFQRISRLSVIRWP